FHPSCPLHLPLVPLRSPLFPYTTLFRSRLDLAVLREALEDLVERELEAEPVTGIGRCDVDALVERDEHREVAHTDHPIVVLHWLMEVSRLFEPHPYEYDQRLTSWTARDSNPLVDHTVLVARYPYRRTRGTVRLRRRVDLPGVHLIAPVLGRTTRPLRP